MKAVKHQPYTKLKRTLASLGVTYKDISNVIHVSEATVMLKINGESDFYISEQKAICETFGIDPAIFFAVDVT